MDAITYLKTYRRMREAEGLSLTEKLFNTDATPEEMVALVEEWGEENTIPDDKELHDYQIYMKGVIEDIHDDIERHRDIISILNLRLVQLQLQIDRFKTEEDDDLTTKEVMEILGVCDTTLWLWAKNNYLKPAKAGRKVLYRRSDVLRLLETKEDRV